MNNTDYLSLKNIQTYGPIIDKLSSTDPVSDDVRKFVKSNSHDLLNFIDASIAAIDEYKKNLDKSLATTVDASGSKIEQNDYLSQQLKLLDALNNSEKLEPTKVNRRTR